MLTLVLILPRSLPTAPGLWSEEGGEALHKLERFRRLHHARKNDISENMGDIVRLQFCAAHPSILCHIKKSLVPKRRKKSPQPEDMSIDDLLVSPPPPKEVELEVEKTESPQVGTNDSDEEFDFGSVEVEELKALESDSESVNESDESDESDIEFVVEEEEESEDEEF